MTINPIKIISVKGRQKISLEIPVELLTRDQENFDNALLIFTPNTREMKVFHSDSQVFFFELFIQEYNLEFLVDMNKTLTNINISWLYASEICSTEENCGFEIFVDLSQITISIERVAEALRDVKGVDSLSYRLLRREENQQDI